MRFRVGQLLSGLAIIDTDGQGAAGEESRRRTRFSWIVIAIIAAGGLAGIGFGLLIVFQEANYAVEFKNRMSEATGRWQRALVILRILGVGLGLLFVAIIAAWTMFGSDAQ